MRLTDQHKPVFARRMHHTCGFTLFITRQLGMLLIMPDQMGIGFVRSILQTLAKEKVLRDGRGYLWEIL